MITGAAYTGSRDLDCIRRDMQSLASQGYTHVCHLYSESDIEYYSETMNNIISMSKSANLSVYVLASGIGRVFDGDELSEFAGRHLDQSQIDNHGNHVVASCINAPKFQKYLRDWIEWVGSSEADVVVWDNPHFFSNDGNEGWCCSCNTCKKLFRKTTGHLLPSSLTESVRNFRLTSLVDFIAELTGLVHRKKKKNAVVLPPPLTDDDEHLWKEIAALPTVDELCIKPDWKRGTKAAQISQNYHKMSKTLKALANESGKEASVWIKNHNIQKNNEESVAEATYAAYNEGIRILFASEFMGSVTKSSRKCDNPQKVWVTQTEAFAECHEKAIMNEMIDVLKSTRDS